MGEVHSGYLSEFAKKKNYTQPHEFGFSCLLASFQPIIETPLNN